MAHKVEQSPTNQKVGGSILGSYSPHVTATEPQIASMQFHAYMCIGIVIVLLAVCEFVVRIYAKKGAL